MAVAKSCPNIKTLNLDCTAIMLALGGTARTSNRSSSNKGFIRTMLQQLENLIGGESLLHQPLINKIVIATYEVFETADDNSSTPLMKEENQDWNMTVADVMIGGSRRASISTPAQLKDRPPPQQWKTTSTTAAPTRPQENPLRPLNPGMWTTHINCVTL